MKTKLTIIVDNIPNGILAGEWGLSILVEHNRNKILVDAGASELFSTNLKKLGYDIREIDYAVLSHAHYDHANGMPRFFSDNNKAKFYLRETTDENCYAKKLFIKKYIGIPRNVLARYEERIEIVSGNCKLCDGAYLIPHSTDGLEHIGRRENMYRKTARGFVPDDFAHEQSLVLETDKGLVIINCCSHGGAVNIINETRAAFPGHHIYGLIGGFHLFNKSPDEVRETARGILETGIDFVCTGHCTGERACQIMKEEMGDKLSRIRTGLILEF